MIIVFTTVAVGATLVVTLTRLREEKGLPAAVLARQTDALVVAAAVAEVYAHGIALT